jgi:hypothetical protein
LARCSEFTLGTFEATMEVVRGINARLAFNTAQLLILQIFFGNIERVVEKAE